LSVKIRTRPNGQRYPITQKNNTLWWKAYIKTPDQLLKNFNGATSRDEKVKIKRIAVSQANTLNSVGKGEEAYQYEKAIKQMYIPTRYNLTPAQQTQVTEVLSTQDNSNGESPKNS
jgi:hypothetical protein